MFPLKQEELVIYLTGCNKTGVQLISSTPVSLSDQSKTDKGKKFHAKSPCFVSTEIEYGKILFTKERTKSEEIIGSMQYDGFRR